MHRFVNNNNNIYSLLNWDLIKTIKRAEMIDYDMCEQSIERYDLEWKHIFQAQRTSSANKCFLFHILNKYRKNGKSMHTSKQV